MPVMRHIVLILFASFRGWEQGKRPFSIEKLKGSWNDAIGDTHSRRRVTIADNKLARMWYGSSCVCLCNIRFASFETLSLSLSLSMCVVWRAFMLITLFCKTVWNKMNGVHPGIHSWCFRKFTTDADATHSSCSALTRMAHDVSTLCHW